MEASFTKLLDGSWGIRIERGYVSPGEHVEILKKDGTKTTVRVGSLIYQNSELSYAIYLMEGQSFFGDLNKLHDPYHPTALYRDFLIQLYDEAELTRYCPLEVLCDRLIDLGREKDFERLMALDAKAKNFGLEKITQSKKEKEEELRESGLQEKMESLMNQISEEELLEASSRKKKKKKKRL